jgi:hypothetical protein
MAAGGVRTLIVRFTGETKGLDKAAKTASGQMDKGKASFQKLNKAAVLASTAVVGAFAVWAKGAIGAAEEGLAAERKLANVFEQMGGGASAAFQQAGDAAKQIGKDLAVPATEVTEIQTKLATFGEIWDDPVKGAENFNRASTLAFDLAAAGFGSADSNATQLGKALQDPVKGMTALTRSGVSFTDQEKEKIKQLQESGDMLGAQEMIYAALEKQVGGTAEAGVTDTQRMQVAIGELSESFGRMLLPAVQKVTGWIGQLVEWMERNKTIVAIAAGVVVGLAAAILAVNAAIKIWRAMVMVATAVQWAWNIAMSANPIGLIILAIAALIAIIILVVKNWDWVKEKFFIAWDFIWSYLKQWMAWLKSVFWDNGIKKYFQMVGAILNWVRDRFVQGFNGAKSAAAKVVDWLRGIPGRIRSAFAKVTGWISAPFKAGFDAVKRFWNNTIGGKGFTIPSWVPGVGGNEFRFPKFHSGGVVPGPLGREVPILARAGERIITHEGDRARGGGEFVGTLVLDSGEFLGRVRGVIREENRGARQRVLAGTGGRR